MLFLGEKYHLDIYLCLFLQIFLNICKNHISSEIFAFFTSLGGENVKINFFILLVSIFLLRWACYSFIYTISLFTFQYNNRPPGLWLCKLNNNGLLKTSTVLMTCNFWLISNTSDKGLNNCCSKLFIPFKE